ncbi:MAG TPA: PIN domain-containing protein [Thermoleophilia bacterium]|nr:PIN domain-containing protein [Thermoleophilia bacterium]
MGELRGALFVDANVFLRYLTNDVPEQAEAVESLFRDAADGHACLVTNVMVLAELVRVMESQYRLSKQEVHRRALAVATMEGLDLPGLDLVVQALFDYLEKNVDFIDAYNVAWAGHRAIDTIVTFDSRHLGRFPGLTVVTPGT